MEKFIALNKNTSTKVIPFNPESPFVKITKITIPSLTNENISALKNIIECISVDFFKSNSKNRKGSTDSLYTGFNHLRNGGIQLAFEIDKSVIFNTDFDKLELIYNNDYEEDLEIHVHYITINNNVSLKSPFGDFKRHIEQSDNVKILFSAPFGQGKTTFLNYFFEEQHKDTYEVFKVFPVNYSISHNEDVFKYIKTEILFKLLSTNVSFDKESFSYYQTVPQFFKSDPIRVFSTLVSLIPKIGKSAYDILDPLYKLAKDCFDHHDKMKIDDEQKTKEFIEELYAKEGSVFEDNFYTQLIRQLLERLKVDSGKENVLIIEDLDRMDPDHIFRILNIFAAHFDAPELGESTNKFGFDKIIIVGDYNNIRHTFAYRYGPNVDFEGYINKYYSKEPFYYDNKHAITELTWSLREHMLPNKTDEGLDFVICVLTDLIDSGSITLRDIIKLKKLNIRSIISGKFQESIKNSKHYYNKLLYFNLFFYLSKIYDIDSLILKFNNCKNKELLNDGYNYDYYTHIGLVSLAMKDGAFSNYEITFKSKVISIKVEETITSGYRYYNGQNSVDESNRAITFNKVDFYDMLILNAEKYKEVGGFN